MTVVEINTNDCLNLVDYPNKPSERFFANQQHIQDLHVYEPIVFKCYNCKYEIEFKEGNFQKHSNSAFSNLQNNDKMLLEDYKNKNRLLLFSFLDFYCPKCGQGTQILYEDSYGGKSEYLISIKNVLIIK